MEKNKNKLLEFVIYKSGEKNEIVAEFCTSLQGIKMAIQIFFTNIDIVLC